MQSYNFALANNPRQPSVARTWRRNQNTIKFQTRLSLGPISHTVLIAVMLTVLGLIYLTQITKTGTFGYEIQELSAKKAELASQTRDLEVESARLQSLSRVRESNVAQTLTTPSQTDFASSHQN